MSRSQALKKQLPNGDHLVCITDVAKENNEILITFADGKNNQFQKIYDFNSSEFIKLCHAAGTINKGEVFNSLDCIGQTLWITVANDNITDTCAHIEGVGIDLAHKYTAPFQGTHETESGPKDLKLGDTFPLDKKKVIEEAREMIKKVESGNHQEEPAKDNIFARKLKELEDEDIM